MSNGMRLADKVRHIVVRAVRVFLVLVAVSGCSIATNIRPGIAEPVLDRALSSVQTVDREGCVLLQVSFNFRVQYSGHTPTSNGGAVTVRIRAIDRELKGAISTLRREALRPLKIRFARVTSIVFDASGAAGATLRLEFDRTLHFDVAPGPDATDLIFALAGSKRDMCRPVFPANVWRTTTTPSRKLRRADAPKSLVARKTGPSNKSDERRSAALMDESRAAIKKRKYAQAVVKLRSVLRAPENRYSKEAQELLGSAYKKMGDFPSAKLQFQDYLERYPDGEDAERVRQRLRGVLTVGGSPPPRRRKAKRRRRSKGPESGAEWSVAGSLSQTYVRDDSFRKLRDPSLPPEVNADPEKHEVNRNALLSSFVLSANWVNSFAKSKFKFAGTEKHDLSGEESDIVGVSSLYYAADIHPWNLSFKIGRQRGNSGGVFGRFDGASLIWQANETLRFGLVGGSPVNRREDLPYKDEKVFYGASIGFMHPSGLDASFYGIEQRAGSLIDRRAIGLDLRYLSPNISAFSTIDYDIHFQEFNLATFNGSWTLPDKTVLHAIADYRKTPFLTSSNALQGQFFATLYDFLKAQSEDIVYQTALDRTAAYRSVNIGFSRPIYDNLQFAFDATWVNTSGTPASLGVPALQDTGDEFYYSAQLIATNLFTENDTSIAAVRYADRRDTDLWVLDLQTRYPVNSSLWLRPRLRLGYLTGPKFDLTEYTVQPSLLIDYAVQKNLHLEFEVGANWRSRYQGSLHEQNTDVFFTIGYRYDFDLWGKSPCRLPGMYCSGREPRR